METLSYVAAVIGWDLLLFVTHVLAHRIGWLWWFHSDHHEQVANGHVGWHWSNMLLCVDTVKSTVDEWAIQIIPTLIYCWLFDVWWIAGFYLVWVALVQEHIDHIDRPLWTSGRWHMIHHEDSRRHYGAFLPWWDWIIEHKKTPVA